MIIIWAPSIDELWMHYWPITIKNPLTNSYHQSMWLARWTTGLLVPNPQSQKIGRVLLIPSWWIPKVSTATSKVFIFEMLSGQAINKCLRFHNWIISKWDRTEPALTPSCGWYTSMDLTDYWWLVSHTLLVGFMRPTPWSYTSGHKQPMDINWRYLGIDWIMFTGESVIVWFMYWPTHWSYRFTMARHRGNAGATMTIPWGVTLVVANGFDVYLWSSMVACSTFFWRFLLVSVRVVISDQWLLLPFPAYQLLWTIVNPYDLLLALLA